MYSVVDWPEGHIYYHAQRKFDCNLSRTAITESQQKQSSPLKTLHFSFVKQFVSVYPLREMRLNE